VKAIGSVVEHTEAGIRGVCTAAEVWENPATQRVAFTVFVRPVGGGKEWTAPPSRVRLVVDAG
jgi:hypothetical protein